jgi:hypothetical protein
MESQIHSSAKLQQGYLDGKKLVDLQIIEGGF